jgi:phosphopantetheine--protein transferase-like protein
MLSAGIDIEKVQRFAFVATAAGVAFLQRVYTEAERSACGNDVVKLAFCFSGKEAVAKALGEGLTIRENVGVPCLDIEVHPPEAGCQPIEATLYGRAAMFATQLRISTIELMWKHDGWHVCALAWGRESSDDVALLRRTAECSLERIFKCLHGGSIGEGIVT